MSWNPAELLFLASIALVIAFFAIGEMLEMKRAPRQIRALTERDRLASALRHLPLASREAFEKEWNCIEGKIETRR